MQPLTQQNIKNLLPRPLLNDDSIQPLLKKIQQHRKTTQTTLQHFNLINKNLQTFHQSFQTQVFTLNKQLTETTQTQSENQYPKYFCQLTQLFKNINIEIKVFSEKTNGSFKELNNICNVMFLDYSNVVLNFQQHLRNYQSTEIIVLELGKKYWRTYKNMQSYLESYKNSFTDARLIYNNEEKIKRYSLCQNTYKMLTDDSKNIHEKCEKLNQKKSQIRKSFLNIEVEMKKTLKVISSKIITETKEFVKNFGEFQKTLITFLAEKKFSLEKLKIQTFFQSIDNTQFIEYFSLDSSITNNKVNSSQQHLLYPVLFTYQKHIKPQYIPFCRSAFLSYLRQVQQKSEERKTLNKKILELLKLYIKMLEKSNYQNLKDINSNFDRIKKRLSELFGGRFVSFIKSIHAIFELSIGIHEKLLKTIYTKIKIIENAFIEDNKILDMFVKELKINIEKFINRTKEVGGSGLEKGGSNSGSTSMRNSSINLQSSILSTNSNRNKPSFKNEQTFNSNSINNRPQSLQPSNTSPQPHYPLMQKQLIQTSQFLLHLIQGFYTKMQTQQNLIKQNCNILIHDFSMSINQFYSLCCEYENIYFGSEEFIINYQKYQKDINDNLVKESNWILNESMFGTCEVLMGDKQQKENEMQSEKIVFDDDLSRIEEFKKLKKPNFNDVGGGEKDGLNNSEAIDINGNVPRKSSTGSGNGSASLNQSQRQPQFISNQNPADNSKNSPSPLSLSTIKTLPPQQPTSDNNDQNQSALFTASSSNTIASSDKYHEFLHKKIKFLPSQQFIKTYSCAFYDKIILQGRIYITTQRICFHSKFNPNNVFFGDTFIQVPKKDITKVQKRYNALIFDNSIAITTINGEMFFTSFFSRDSAYETITKSLDLNPMDKCFDPKLMEEEEQKIDYGDGVYVNNDSQQGIENQGNTNSNNPSNIQSSQTMIHIKQQDDLSPEKQSQRSEQIINKELQSHPYDTLINTTFEYQNLNALKFFRLFDSGKQITHNKKTQKNFNFYIEQSMSNKQISISHFKPNILEYLNHSNIKDSTPIKVSRKICSMVPVSAAGIPFMPKFAKSAQEQLLYFISKDKYIIESNIETSGAPYTDCFNVKVRRTIESVKGVQGDKVKEKSQQEGNSLNSIGSGKVTMKVQMCVNMIKSTMMKSMIKSTAIDQTKKYFKKMSDECEKYFVELEKKKKKATQAAQAAAMKKNAHQSLHPQNPQEKNSSNIPPPQPQNQHQEQIESLKKQLEEVTTEKQKLHEKVQQLETQNQQFKKVILGLAALCFLLVLILMN